jgi:hypothetical protein
MPVGNKKAVSIRLYESSLAKLEYIKGFYGLNTSDSIAKLIDDKDKSILRSAKKSKKKK